MAPDNPRQLARARIDKGGERSPIAPGVVVTQTTLADRPALHFMPQRARPGGLLFLHGGGYVIGSPQSHKPFVSQLAHALKLEAWSLDYRLAPEDVCPAAIEDGGDALAVLRAKIDGPLIVSGDSAGGGLTLASVIRHRDAGRAAPDGLYLISPWTDLSASGESATAKAHADPMLKPHYLEQAAALYLDGRSPQDPEASPLFADLSGLPPTLIQVGEDEILLDDSIRLANKLNAAGVDATCQIWEAMWHDFQLFAPLLPEGTDAVRHVKRWANERLF